MIVDIALGAFALAALGGVIRLVRGPSLPDRVVALDVLLMALMGAIAVIAIERDSVVLLNLPVVIALVGFTATVAAARFVETGTQELP